MDLRPFTESIGISQEDRESIRSGNQNTHGSFGSIGGFQPILGKNEIRFKRMPKRSASRVLRDADKIYDTEAPVLYASESKLHPAATKGLGTWSFDMRAKRRKYFSLGGRVFTGNDAMRQFREDQASEEHPAKSARGELTQLMQDSAKALEGYMGTTVDLASCSSPCAADLHDLRSWGIPPRTLARYAAEGVTRLFDWQAQVCIDVLLHSADESVPASSRT